MCIPGVVVVVGLGPLRVALLLQRDVSPGILLSANGGPSGVASLDPWSRRAIGNLGRVTTDSGASKSLGIRFCSGITSKPKVLRPVIAIGLGAQRAPVAGSVVSILVLRILTNFF